ncbi:MAG: HEAT repeat domain-containing protein [Phycisphaeraceae bacterium JB051]
MAKLEDELAKLNDLDFSDPTQCDAAYKVISRALTGKNNHLIARAATLISEHKLEALLPKLEQAFERLLPTASRVDKGGSAMTALAKSMTLLHSQATELFVSGSRHIQMEPVYGGKVDVADHLRGWCAQGLAQTGDLEALPHIAGLLADPCPQTRLAAIKAVEISGRADVGLPLMVLKLAQGDPEPQVYGQCVTAILHLGDATSVSLFCPLLDHDDPSVVEQVLLAIGQSRDASLSDLLIEFYERSLEPDIQKSILLAMAMLRSDSTLTYLEDLVVDGSERAAEQAIDALGIYHYDKSLQQKLVVFCADRADRFLLQKVKSIFDQ